MEILTGALQQLVDIQRQVSGMVGAIPPEGSEIPNSHVTAMAFALQGEVFEMLQELGWKYWANPKEMTPERVAAIAEEYADILAFLGTLTYYVMARTGLTPSDLAMAYFMKSDKNVQRFLGQIEGYDRPAGL